MVMSVSVCVFVCQRSSIDWFYFRSTQYIAIAAVGLVTQIEPDSIFSCRLQMNELMTSCNSENVQLITAIWVFVFRRLNETYNETYNGRPLPLDSVPCPVQFWADIINFSFIYWHRSHSMRQGLCNGLMVSVRISVPSIDCCSSVWWVCCWAPRRQATSIDCCSIYAGRRSSE